METLRAAIFSLIVVGLAAVFAWLWTPSAAPFDRQAAMKAAALYDARIIRDAFGVPHIYGARDADVAFGLAYAHAEDDWKTIEDVIFFSRGALARQKGKDAAIPDFLVGALGVTALVEDQYSGALGAETRAIVEAYAAGLNVWCAELHNKCAPGAAPVTGEDVIAGFVSRTPFFYGLDEELTQLFKDAPDKLAAAKAARHALLDIAPSIELGSNAMAVANPRSADGHTRLMVNSHQPYTGPVAWYEARLKSEEGWDMIGALFPGAPLILVGAGPQLGWAHTVNRPDLADVYKLSVDDESKPTSYKFDGEWRELDRKEISFRVKLWGPFSLPVKRMAYRSVHGPAFVTPNGVFAVAYGGMDNIRQAEQWFRMNKAQSFAEWKSAMELSAIPSLNAIYGDRAGVVAYFYNAAIPIRDPSYDWSGILPGDVSATLWKGIRQFDAVPSVERPASGYVLNANNNPFEASSVEDNPDREKFPPHFGIDDKTTNRGLREQELYGADASITGEEFVAYKFDHKYSKASRVRQMVSDILNSEIVPNDALMESAVTTLRNWDGSTQRENRGAALAILTAQKARGYLLDDVSPEQPDYEYALRSTAKELMNSFGRVDPKWRDVMRFHRGAFNSGIDGGPDILRAVYASSLDVASGPLTAAAGDTYILYADWPAPEENGQDGDPVIKTIHQFGASTSHPQSPHYGDQAPIFVDEQWKSPSMSLDALLLEATSDKRVGGGVPK